MTDCLPADQAERFMDVLLQEYTQNDTRLQLSNRNISGIPAGAFLLFPALETLDLSHNSLTSYALPCGALTPVTLKHLSLSSNDLSSVPSCLPAALKFLDLSNNAILQIHWYELKDLHNLSVLILNHNKISEMVWSEAVLPPLVSLDLGYNNLTKLQWQSEMPDLAVMKLEGNPRLEISPHQFSHLPGLRELNLSHTTLNESSYKAFASKLGNLQSLDLSANLFQILDPQWFATLRNLQVFWMRQTLFLKSLPPDLFVYTPNLAQVDFGENPQLRFVNSSMFEHLPRLEFLNLESCNLTQLRPWKFNNCSVTIRLFGNPLDCSCDLTWLLTTSQKVLMERASDTVCYNHTQHGESLSTYLLSECNLEESALQLQTDAGALVTNPLLRTTAVLHGSKVSMETTSAMSSSHNQSQHQFVFGTGRQHTFPSSGSTAQGTAGLKDHNQATIILLPPEVKKSPPSQQMTNRGQLHPSTMVATERSKTPLSVLATFTTAKQVVPVFLVSEDEHSESLKEGEEIKEKSEHMQAGECNYDPCRHWQVPCHDLQLLTGCSCPTMTGEDVKPKPAKIQKVLKISDRSGEIYWCAPNSVVLHYYIIYQSDENKHLYKTDIINPTYRRYTLHDLASDTTYHVCVIAVNKAGTSPSSTIWPAKGGCYIFKTKPNYNSIFYTVCTIAIVILLILVVVLTACLCRIHQKRGLMDSTLLNLGPLSLQNPAYDEHMDRSAPRASISTINMEDQQDT
eukprot:gi/632961073/ref/XP_007896550.1/ PREDICTED: leucine-rich repeat neuronal protein 4 [Callorhinchus milii]